MCWAGGYLTGDGLGFVDGGGGGAFLLALVGLGVGVAFLGCVLLVLSEGDLAGCGRRGVVARDGLLEGLDVGLAGGVLEVGFAGDGFGAGFEGGAFVGDGFVAGLAGGCTLPSISLAGVPGLATTTGLGFLVTGGDA